VCADGEAESQGLSVDVHDGHYPHAARVEAECVSGVTEDGVVW